MHLGLKIFQMIPAKVKKTLLTKHTVGENVHRFHGPARKSRILTPIPGIRCHGLVGEKLGETFQNVHVSGLPFDQIGNVLFSRFAIGTNGFLQPFHFIGGVHRKGKPLHRYFPAWCFGSFERGQILQQLLLALVQLRCRWFWK